MSKLSAKRQVTLPIDQCRELGIEPGDDLEFFVANGQLTVIKKIPDAAKGDLKHVRSKKKITDEQSRQSALR